MTERTNLALPLRYPYITCGNTYSGMLDLNEGSEAIFGDGTIRKITYIDGCKKARIKPVEYVTEDGKKHYASDQLYVDFR